MTEEKAREVEMFAAAAQRADEELGDFGKVFERLRELQTEEDKREPKAG